MLDPAAVHAGAPVADMHAHPALNAFYLRRDLGELGMPGAEPLQRRETAERRPEGPHRQHRGRVDAVGQHP